MHSRVWKRCGAVLCAALLSMMLIIPASAAGETLTLTGPISGMYEIPEGVTKVVLDGVQGADFESGIKIPAAAEVVLRDGSENVCGVICMGDLHVTGGGALLGGPGLYAFGNLTLDLTGNVVFEGGQIAAFGGDVTVNSGTYRLQSLPEGGGGLIVASQGGVWLNGGDVKIYNDSVGVSATDGDITVAETELDITAEDAVMLANNIILPDSAQSAVAVRPQGDGAVIVTEDEPARRVRVTASGGETAAEPGEPVIQDGKADVGAAVSLGERSADAETVAPVTAQNEPVDPFAWILAGAAAVLGVAAAVWYFWKKKKHSE